MHFSSLPTQDLKLLYTLNTVLFILLLVVVELLSPATRKALRIWIVLAVVVLGVVTFWGTST